MQLDYFRDHQTLIITCLVIGLVFGLILPMILAKLKTVWDGIWGFIGTILTFVVSKSYFIWFIISLQVAFGLFLFQQWIFRYNYDNGGNTAYDQYAYLPLTFVIPAFFCNLLLFVASFCRLNETSEAEEKRKK